ncbi:MAG: O-antigen ligase family protein, partial [Flavobacteriales bacterium]|nr:O-antigen ligase family protein [Flavobacteriales bacterium]
IWGDFNFSKPQSLFGLIENSSELTIADKFADIYRNKALDFEHPDKLIYLIDGRIYSNDVTSNWRLQIWQDVINDLFIKNKIFFGYGYNEIIPAMDEVERRGTDGTNENVHNYIINILARGGLAQLAFFIYAYIQTVNKFFIKKEKLYAIQFLLTVMIVSFFDSSMESVRFPVIFYSVSGFFIQNSLKTIK